MDKIYFVSLENTDLTLDSNLHHNGELVNLNIQLRDHYELIYVNHSNIDELLKQDVSGICFVHEGVWSYHSSDIRNLSLIVNVNKNIKFLKRFRNVYTDKYSIKKYPVEVTRVYLPELLGFTSSKLVLGDSHSLTYSEYSANVHRYDGWTLNRFLNEHISSYLSNYDEVVFYAGNIDIINHFHKHGYDYIKTKELVTRLVSQLNDIGIDYKISELIKINMDNNKLRVDKYLNTEGHKYSGTLTYIHTMVDLFNSILRDQTQHVISNPKLILDDNGISVDQMADNDGLHIKPEFYVNF